MPLGSMRSSPRVLNLPLTATGVAPTLLRDAPFAPGQVVEALSAGAAALRGGCFDRATAKKSLRFKVAAADVSIASGVVSQVATGGSRDSSGNVTGVLVVTFGNAARQLLDDGTVGIPDYTTAADADEALKVVVLVNGVPFGRIVDAAAPAPAAGQYGMDNDTNDNFNLLIFADATNPLYVGSDVEVLLVSDIAALAVKSATTGLLSAGGALTAGVLAERYLGTAETGLTDTAGRTTTALNNADVVMSEVAACALLPVAK